MATTTTADKNLLTDAQKIDAELKAVIAHIQRSQKGGNWSGAYHENNYKIDLQKLLFELKPVMEKFYNNHVHVFEMQVNRPLARLTPEMEEAIRKMRGK